MSNASCAQYQAIRKAFCFFYEPVGVSSTGAPHAGVMGIDTIQSRQSPGEAYRLQSLFHSASSTTKPGSSCSYGCGLCRLSTSTAPKHIPGWSHSCTNTQHSPVGATACVVMQAKALHQSIGFCLEPMLLSCNRAQVFMSESDAVWYSKLRANRMASTPDAPRVSEALERYHGFLLDQLCSFLVRGDYSMLVELLLLLLPEASPSPIGLPGSRTQASYATIGKQS